MIQLNLVLYASVLGFLFTKIICYMMHTKNLSSIPENDSDDDKWIPKKKHEVLKAKYKCLKKLFQIYDASIIGVLPETYLEEPVNHRRKRSKRSKVDAYAETNAESIAILTETKHTLSETTHTVNEIAKSINDKYTQDSKENVTCNEVQCECNRSIHDIPYYIVNEKRKPTRLQSFVQRIFGIKRDRNQRNYAVPGHVYAASDNNISNRYEKRRRRGIRFRRIRRTKKVHSEITLRDVNSPVILSYVQSVQRHCLMDTTPRQCPILGCRMMFYGIINYNDHLNLCHFPERKHICHYCHEGFTNEQDKYHHENEHIGITKISPHVVSTPSTTGYSNKIASNTQTDPEPNLGVPEEKLKKIVSFFDKMADVDPKKSDPEIKTIHRCSKTDTTSESSSEKRSSCVNLSSRKCMSEDSGVTSKFQRTNTCNFCGEHFDYRRQLCLHMDLEHRMHSKYSKFHSCVGILNHPDTTSQSKTSHTSAESLSYEPSTNIVYYTSLESLKKPSVVNKFVNKVRNGFSYKWEPGSVVRV